jgi:hypothetical protein
MGVVSVTRRAPVPIIQEGEWATELVWTQARGKILSPLPGIEPGSHGRPVRSQTLYWLSYPCYLCKQYLPVIFHIEARQDNKADFMEKAYIIWRLTFSQRWSLSCSFGLLHHVDSCVEPSVSKKHTFSIFSPEGGNSKFIRNVALTGQNPEKQSWQAYLLVYVSSVLSLLEFI